METYIHTILFHVDILMAWVLNSLTGHTYFACAHWRRAQVGGTRKEKGEEEKYVWCKRRGFYALTLECWLNQSDCS